MSEQLLEDNRHKSWWDSFDIWYECRIAISVLMRKPSTGFVGQQFDSLRFTACFQSMLHCFISHASRAKHNAILDVFCHVVKWGIWGNLQGTYFFLDILQIIFGRKTKLQKTQNCTWLAPSSTFIRPWNQTQVLSLSCLVQCLCLVHSVYVWIARTVLMVPTDYVNINVKVHANDHFDR